MASRRLLTLSKGYRQFVSIDPAKKNFSIRIERRYPDRVETGAFLRLDLTTRDDSSLEGSLIRLTNKLDELAFDIMESDFIFVEKQLTTNTMATRVMQHVLTYMMLRCKDNAVRTRLFDVNPKLKNNIICPPKKTASKEIKKLSVIKGRTILERRRDEKALLILAQNKSKQDDLCDTICQLEAMLQELNIPDGL